MVSEDVDLKSALLVEIKPPLAVVAIGVGSIVHEL